MKLPRSLGDSARMRSSIFREETVERHVTRGTGPGL
jgi:hypothetical protein